MKKRSKGRSGKDFPLTEEDRALWSHLASSLDPLKRLKSRVHPVQEQLDSYMVARNAPLSGSAANANANQEATKPHPLPASQPPKRLPPPVATLDRKSARRLRSGQIEIEARIDLHGLRQSEAHAALRRFIMSCHAADKRWVLVITGKGGALNHRDSSREHGPSWSEPERGVLRRSVPRWLAEPDLRSLVVSHTTAAIQHGGEGALYVQIRARHRISG